VRPVRGRAARREDGGRRYVARSGAGRPPGAPEGRALDLKEPNSATIVEESPKRYWATWHDQDGKEQSAVFASEPQAVNEVVHNDAGGLRFHDLRHSYATWLVYAGVPINDAQRLLGHSRPSTTLDLYTHAQQHLDPRVGDLFDAFSLPLDDDEASGGTNADTEDVG